MRPVQYNTTNSGQVSFSSSILLALIIDDCNWETDSSGKLSQSISSSTSAVEAEVVDVDVEEESSEEDVLDVVERGVAGAADVERAAEVTEAGDAISGNGIARRAA